MDPQYDPESGTVVWGVSDANPRNGEGDVLELPDGTLFLAYGRFDAGGDEAPAVIRGVFSDDGGKTWRDEYAVQGNIGRCNVMCANLLTLQDGRVALVFNVKNGQVMGDLDCRPYIIYSDDNCATWSQPQAICTDVGRYYVLENARLVQLSTGRIIVPLALLVAMDPWWFAACCAYSDDGGVTWRMSEFAAARDRLDTGMVETGVVELDPERRQIYSASAASPALLMYGRSCYGQILHCLSTNGGITWSTPRPLGPQSPSPVQQSAASELVDLEYLLAMDEVKALPDPAFLYCGAAPFLDSAAETAAGLRLPEETSLGVEDAFLVRLHDPVLDRTIEHPFRALPLGDDLHEREDDLGAARHHTSI